MSEVLDIAWRVAFVIGGIALVQWYTERARKRRPASVPLAMAGYYSLPLIKVDPKVDLQFNIGEIHEWDGERQGWLPCDGQLIAKTYTDVIKQLKTPNGYLFGELDGYARTPDLRGNVLRNENHEPTG